MRRVWQIISTVFTVLSLSGCCCLPGEQILARLVRSIDTGEVRRETHQVGLDGVSQVDAVLQFAGGELIIERGDTWLMSGEFLYNLDDLKPVVLYDRTDQRGVLEVRHKSDTIRWDRSTGAVRNEWNLQLTDRVPIGLRVDAGASRGEMNLGGLRITQLNLAVGVADMTIRFGEPNSERLETVQIHSGAARLVLEELGNANMDQLSFDGGLGTYTFDFRGAWQRAAQVHIQAGASEVQLYIPRSIGARVCPGDFRNGDYDGLEAQDDCYVNRLYGQSDITLDIDLDLGLGKLDVRQVD